MIRSEPFTQMMIQITFPMAQADRILNINSYQTIGKTTSQRIRPFLVSDDFSDKQDHMQGQAGSV